MTNSPIINHAITAAIVAILAHSHLIALLAFLVYGS